MNLIELPDTDKSAFRKALDKIQTYVDQHRWQFGAAEMAIGAALVAWGIESGAITMGQQLVASVFESGETEGILGASTGAALGVLPGLVLKSIGIAALGTAVSVPALVLMGGGALVMGLAGYGAGRAVADFLNQAPDLAAFASSSGVLLLGVALLVDGARRICTDEKVKALATRFSDGALHLKTLAKTRVIESVPELVTYLDVDLRGYLGTLRSNPAALAGTTVGVAAGAAVGSVAAASSVTVLGSSALGGVALSLGLVSAPLWPVIAGGGAAVAASYGAWKYLDKKRRKAPEEPRDMGPLRLS